jgi:putative ABC transport system ATP-binding protein
MKPALLLADEPTGNLDSASGREIIGLIEGMNARGLTLIVVTHDPLLGQRARRQIRLSDGLILSDHHQPQAAPQPSAPAARIDAS